eukprot:g3571.t1
MQQDCWLYVIQVARQASIHRVVCLAMAAANLHLETLLPTADEQGQAAKQGTPKNVRSTTPSGPKSRQLDVPPSDPDPNIRHSFDATIPAACGVLGCSTQVYAAGYCAIHLPTRQADVTPTSLNRYTWSLWQTSTRAGSTDSKTMVTTWKFVYDGDFRLLMLHHNLVEDTFSVFLDGRPQHTSKAQKSSRAWSVEIVLDGKTIPLKCNISASQPEKGRKKPFEYKLMLNDLPFVEAEQLFLKHIATVRRVTVWNQEQKQN